MLLGHWTVTDMGGRVGHRLIIDMVTELVRRGGGEGVGYVYTYISLNGMKNK
jgi:hypothetical protein